MLPPYRSVDMVQKGVGYWYCLVSALQIGWTVTFAYEMIPASLGCMLGLWLSLMGLLYSQYYTNSDGTFIGEFLFLRFPFALHAGWITAASVLNGNVYAVELELSADILLAVAIVSIAVLHAVSVWVLFNIPRPNWTIAGVLSWAFGWIYVELQDPQESIIDTFEPNIINGVAYAAIAVGAGAIPAQFVLRVLLLAVPKWNPYQRTDGLTKEVIPEPQSVTQHRGNQVAPVTEPEAQSIEELPSLDSPYYDKKTTLKLPTSDDTPDEETVSIGDTTNTTMPMSYYDSSIARLPSIDETVSVDNTTNSSTKFIAYDGESELEMA